MDFGKVVSDFDDSVTAHPQTQLAIKPDTPTLLPAPVAHSTPQSPVTISSRPDTSNTPMHLVAPIAHLTPQSPPVNRPGTPTPLPAPVTLSTPQSPVIIASRPDTSDTSMRLVAPILIPHNNCLLSQHADLIDLDLNPHHCQHQSHIPHHNRRLQNCSSRICTKSCQINPPYCRT
ncbi:hypothetical protein PoB_005785000 [Plakobranchus ocellatus]|uniref:Uncharacterized protein n=1 Tax=Plakobranchus ocellatus TaxID=259542 RepID=A0AAV4CEV2_9GAST|nr:hypothetical protein PoB_005785000 [Plakobranchus ocellatus]